MAFLAVYDGKRIYEITNLEGFLEVLKNDEKLRRAVILHQVGYRLILRYMKELIKEGFLEITPDSPKPRDSVDYAILRFGKILSQRFPEDWRNAIKRFSEVKSDEARR